MERVFYHAVDRGFAPPFVPNVETVTRVLHEFTAQFRRLIRRTIPVALLVYPEENYRGRKLLIYQRARDHMLGRTPGRKFGVLKSFIKHEKILQKPGKRTVPRIIQPRSPEYNVCVGRYIRQLEHRIYSNIDKLWGGPTVMKGLNCTQQGQAISDAWRTFSNPVGVMMDAVRFDQHVSIPMLQWEHSIYVAHFPPAYRHELQWLLSMQLHNRGRVSCPDGHLSYQVDGCRASGDMNTAMGNVLIMCATMWALVRELHIKARLVNNGDDCCLIVERRDLDRLRERVLPFYADLGFIIDVQGVATCLERVTFCQTHPVYDGRRWCMVRDPYLAISKDATVIKNWSPKEYAVYLHELGVAGLQACGNMPVWASFYRCLARSHWDGPVSDGLKRHVSAPIQDSGLGRLSAGAHNTGPITDAARASFGLAFRMLPQVQLALESYYDQMSPGGSKMFNHPAISRQF